MSYDYQGQLAKSMYADTSCANEVRRATIAESIAQQLNDAKANVARLEELNKLIQENPAIERILTLMNR